jgi:hypothetical protein
MDTICKRHGVIYLADGARDPLGLLPYPPKLALVTFLFER